MNAERIAQIKVTCGSLAHAIATGSRPYTADVSAAIIAIADLFREVERQQQLAIEYARCAKLYQRIKALDMICEQHPGLNDAEGARAEDELMDVCKDLEDTAKYIQESLNLKEAT